ncbi:alkaline phosphatase D family protein [Agrobacterium sp. SHOUNA12C]|nr:alkaline phosphatase D family protein [Agrobacterium sp. BETTINA12B]MCJ9755122.1 alkaline phosphatase D family protein [Agrobacterium sp. SHOUNA12C]
MLLQAAGSLVLFAGLGRHGQAYAAPSLAANPFSLGVAASDPLPDGFVIWTRLAPQPLQPRGGMSPEAVDVRWEVAEDESFGRIARSGETVVRPELAHSVHVEIDGLKPGRTYWYRFHIRSVDLTSVASAIGMARTAPAASALPARLRIVSAGCQSFSHGWYDAWRHISHEVDIDAIFHYGDYIYEGGKTRFAITDANGQPADRQHVGGECYGLDDYRRRYAQYKSDSDLQTAHASAACIVSFDDHEVDNDYASVYDKDGTPPEIFALRRFAAMQAWYEHMPVCKAQFPHPSGLQMYRRLDYGGLMCMHVLDTRSYRNDQLCEKAYSKNCRRDDGPETSILGPQQETWLYDGLVNHARWNFIAQQVRVMPLMNSSTSEALPLLDQWSGYCASRARLVDAISARSLTNVVTASGDAHVHNVGMVPVRDEAPDGPAAATEFLATSITSDGDGAEQNVATLSYESSPNLKLANAQRGYQVFDITAKEWRVDVKVLDRIQSPGGTLSSLGQFTVTPERAQIYTG